MQKKDIISLAVKVSEGNATPEEIHRYITYIDFFIKEFPEWEGVDELSKQTIKEDLKMQIDERIMVGSIKNEIVPFWKRLMYAAAALIILSIGILSYRFSQKHNLDNTIVQKISPGTYGGTLTLANGKRIKLSNAQTGIIAVESGVEISKNSNGEIVYHLKDNEKSVNQINTLTTSNGEMYFLTLPDKSRVWLNSASKLTYSAGLTIGDKRIVKLEGEGYFEVAKDKLHPFVIETKNQKVMVLGTHFNIAAYNNEKFVKTTLVEGSVKIFSNEKTRILKPGQQAINDGYGINVFKSDPEFATAWKENKFMFDSHDIQTIMRMIERWYNVEVIYVGKMPQDTFWGSVSRFNKIEKVLNKLELTDKVRFKINGRKIYVFPQ